MVRQTSSLTSWHSHASFKQTSCSKSTVISAPTINLNYSFDRKYRTKEPARRCSVAQSPWNPNNLKMRRGIRRISDSGCTDKGPNKLGVGAEEIKSDSIGVRWSTRSNEASYVCARTTSGTLEKKSRIKCLCSFGLIHRYGREICWGKKRKKSKVYELRGLYFQNFTSCLLV